MRGLSVRVCALAVAVLLLLAPASLFAQSGKLRGTVVDYESGEPIIGANVEVEGTSRGAATDLDGNFFIIGMPPGEYSVTASAVGYTPVTIEGVEINIDRSSELEFRLQSSAVELEKVTVTWTKPTVEIDVTSKVTRMDSRTLEMMPSNNVRDALLTTPGFKIDQEGNIHIRGGRDSEARFMVEGIDTRDPITGESLPLNLSSINIQEIQILTGGMSAEYGEAMSGYVQISTPEGKTDEYNGTLWYETDQLIDDYSFDQDRVNAAFGGPVPFTRQVMGRPLTFYLTFNGNLSNTHTYLGGEYDAQDYLGLGVNLPRRQSNDWSTSLKMAYDLGNGRKVSAYFEQRQLDWDVYGRGTAEVGGSYGWQYKYNLQNLPQASDRRSNFILEFTNQSSDRTVYNLSVGRRVVDASIQPRGKSPGEFNLVDEIEEQIAFGVDSDQSRNGRWDQDADGDGVVHSGIDELSNDTDNNNFLDGFYDSNFNAVYEGNNEGYEDVNLNGRWDRGEEWVDLNGNGVYDYAEPWTDRTDPVSGENNVGVWDPWDPFIDINGNGVWDPAEPQLAEQDINSNGRWDGERFQDANSNGQFDRWEPFTDLNGNYSWDPGEPFEDLNGNGIQDDGEGYDDANLDGTMNQRDLVNNDSGVEENAEPFWDGDLWNDTGEPFTDLPDPLTGQLNGVWDEGEPFVDLPSSNSGIEVNFGGSGVVINQTQLGTPTLNGKYDPPDNAFDEYELFTSWSGNPQRPVAYTYDPDLHGADWLQTDYLAWQDFYSTWTNRTIHDVDASNGTAVEGLTRFNPPNFSYDAGQERFVDYNGNGVWNGQDLFLNPGRWDDTALWTNRKTTEYNATFKWQSQIHQFHELKFGFDGKYIIMNQQSIEQPDQLYTGAADVNSGEPWPERGTVRDFWEYRPWEGSAYIEDKMEFEGLIVQAGLRGDFIVHDEQVINEQQRRLNAGEPGAVDAKQYQYEFAPRLGISHPITDRSKLYFNYGHFYQRPAFIRYYKSTTTNIDEGVVGNPNLEYEKTVTYELGVHNQITDDISIQIAGYYRDLYDLISTVSVREQGVTVYRYINLDYGRMRGLEMKLEKNFSNHYQFNINYDFSFAFGKSSGVLDEFVNRSANTPVNYDEHPLNWDETHRVTLNGALSYQKREYPVLFGFQIPMDYWLLSVQWQFGSGRPYTPEYLEFTENIDPNLIEENSERLPWTETTSLRFEKYFDTGNIRWIAGFQVYNLFDKKNVNRVHPNTGTTDVAVHPLDPTYNPFLERSEFDSDPRYYGPGRQVLLKVGMEF